MSKDRLKWIKKGLCYFPFKYFFQDIEDTNLEDSEETKEPIDVDGFIPIVPFNSNRREEEE